MINITNTVDAVGDDVLTDSMIERSVAEFQDDHVVKIGLCAFYDCKALKKIVLPEVTELAGYTFQGCSALTSVYIPKLQTMGGFSFMGCTALTYLDFPALNSIGYNEFGGCTALDALILRNTAGVCKHNSGALYGSKIAEGEGYIYVPSALLESYKAAPNWSEYAAQFRAIEDYPEVCERYTWEQVLASIEDGTYKEKYQIGDAVPLDFGSEGVIDMQIAAFDSDTLADGSGTAAITWVGNQILNTSKVFGSKEYTDEYKKLGWMNCSLRTYLQEEIQPMIPEFLRSQIVPVTKTEVGCNRSVANHYFIETTTNELWIPSVREVGLSTSYEPSGPIYDELFASNASRRKKKVKSTKYATWWLRSFNINPYQYTKFVTEEGTGSYYVPADRGVVPCFCTGKTKT